MNKNRILFIISALMIIVMLLAVANRMDILKKDKDNTQAVLKNNDNGEAENNTIEGGKNGTSEIHIKNLEDIPEYEMGEEAVCGSLLPDEQEVIQKRGLIYVANSAYKTNRIEDIPDQLNGMIAGIEPDGYPREGHSFVVVDVTIKNTNKTAIQHYINCVRIAKVSDLTEPISHLCCYGDYQNCLKKDYYCITFEPEGEYHTKLIFTLKEEDIEEEMCMIINPNGVTNWYDGCARIKLTIQ